MGSYQFWQYKNTFFDFFVEIVNIFAWKFWWLYLIIRRYLWKDRNPYNSWIRWHPLPKHQLRGRWIPTLQRQFPVAKEKLGLGKKSFFVPGTEAFHLQLCRSCDLGTILAARQRRSRWFWGFVRRWVKGFQVWCLYELRVCCEGIQGHWLTENVSWRWMTVMTTKLVQNNDEFGG